MFALKKGTLSQEEGQIRAIFVDHFKWSVDLFPVVPRNWVADSQEDVGDR